LANVTLSRSGSIGGSAAGAGLFAGVDLVVTDACGDWKTFVGGGSEVW
jgi:hypothetical protein